MLSKSLLEANTIVFTGSCISVAFFTILLNGVTPIPADKNTAGFE